MKIADFGMSREIYERDYYRMEDMQKPVPMKWMAIESLMEGMYTTKSDVVCVFDDDDKIYCHKNKHKFTL